MARRATDACSARGFVLVEMALVTVVAAITLWLVVVTLVNGSNMASEFQVTSWHSDNRASAAREIWSDLVSTRRAWLDVQTFSDPDFDGDQFVVVSHTARNDNHGFQLLNDGVQAFEPDWQGVIVYCPYKTSEGVTELRRYLCYLDPSQYDYPFTLHSESANPAVKADEIRLRDSGHRKYTIDRHDGNPGAHQPYKVVGVNVLISSFVDDTPDEPIRVELTAVVDSDRYPWLDLTESFYVSPRN